MSCGDTRSAITDRMVPLSGTGGTTTFHKDGLHFYALSGNTTTALACPPYDDLPAGLRFTLDNSHGGGDFTLTPVTGTAIVVNTGEVFDCVVAADKTIRAGAMTAAPTS